MTTTASMPAWFQRRKWLFTTKAAINYRKAGSDGDIDMFFIERRADLRQAHWLVLFVLALPALAHARVADEFLGNRSSDPARCQ